MGSLRSNSHFARAPQVKIHRSAFDRSYTHKTTWDNGDLIPIYWDEVVPGDTVSMDLNMVVRMSTPVKPIMDNVIMDTFWFFVPNRLIDPQWENIMGQLEDTDVWKQTYERTVPQLQFPTDSRLSNSADFGETWYHQLDWTSDDFTAWQTGLASEPRQAVFSREPGDTLFTAVTSYSTFSSTATYYRRFSGWSRKSLMGYLGVPLGSSPYLGTDSNNQPIYRTISQYPVRAYIKVWNDFFRDQNYMLPADLGLNYPLIYGKNYRTGYWGTLDDSGNPYEAPVNLYDYVIDTCKGAKPLRVSRFHDYFSSVLPQPQRGDPALIPTSLSGTVPVLYDSSTTSSNRFGVLSKPYFFNASGNAVFSSQQTAIFGSPASGKGNTLDVSLSSGGTSSGTSSYLSSYADFDHSVASIVNLSTINDLRTAFQVQKFMETYARSGTRYIEIIRGFFGVTNPDYRLQRPEYLGGSRQYINVTQVLQTSSTDSTTPQGNTAAYSMTTAKGNAFTKSFTEHGILIGLACCRTSRSYQQGLNKMFTRKRKYDFLWPQFWHLGNQPVYNYEIFNYANISNSATENYNKGVFGFQEMYSEYRYHPDLVTGQFASTTDEPLDFWHFADYYVKAPYASMDWLLEGPENLDRCLAVTSELADQFVGDFYFKAKYVRPLPMYSVPGLADHF